MNGNPYLGFTDVVGLLGLNALTALMLIKRLIRDRKGAILQTVILSYYSNMMRSGNTTDLV